MRYTIQKGEHRARPIKIGLWFNKSVIAYDVFFHDDCRYYLEGEDMLDTNKLFGIGFFPNHHKDSARIGWRYNSDTDKIILSAYCYVKGERKIFDMEEVELNTWVRCKIKNEFGKYIFYVNSDISTNYVEHLHNKKWAYPLGVFFGGNQPAPGTMNIELKNNL